jgi:two-component system phosphate regulon response regulator PhoB
MTTLLVVDDEEPIRELLASLLEDSGYRVTVAAHGGEALTVVDREAPDLIVADVMMPVISGVELCQRLKQASETKHIPIILMSAAGTKAADAAGADAFIAKPFDIDEMEALISRFVSG